MNKFIDSKYCLWLGVILGLILTFMVLSHPRVYNGYNYGDNLEYSE